ncbi:type II toxin-antitoxin system RelE/ParE family toxin [Paenibacillus puerhi]|uniref:type II toxin-antitoxin system RelE/ParE family toxin n=1 Tax=Paenibacillus puerhi TaxID=2692622 RepID=UPI0038B35753
MWGLRPGSNRILFFGWNGEYFVLLHHFSKTTQKTSPREIAIAKRRIDNWLSRKKKE